LATTAALAPTATAVTGAGAALATDAAITAAAEPAMTGIAYLIAMMSDKRLKRNIEYL